MKLSEMIESYEVVLLDNNMLTIRDVNKLRVVAVELAKALESRVFLSSCPLCIKNCESIGDALDAERKRLEEK